MLKKPFSIVKRDDLTPLCPHCDHELTEVYKKSRGLGLIVGRNVVFFCPHCRKVLGFGQGRLA